MWNIIVFNTPTILSQHLVKKLHDLTK